MAQKRHCVRCWKAEDREAGIIVADIGETDSPLCTLCRADELQEIYGLTGTEARIAARKEAARERADDVKDRADERKREVRSLRRRLKMKIRRVKSFF